MVNTIPMQWRIEEGQLRLFGHMSQMKVWEARVNGRSYRKANGRLESDT